MKQKLKYIFLVLTPAEIRQFWFQIIVNILISIADIAMLAFLLVVVNFYINSSYNVVLDLLPSWMLEPGSITLIAVFFILFSIKNFLGIIVSNAQYRFVGEVAVRISKQKLDRYQRGDYNEFVNIDSAEHIRKIAFQPFEFCQHILSGIQQIIIQSVLVLLTIVAILLYSPGLFFLLLIILLPPVALVFFYLKKNLATTKKNIQVSNERSFQYLLDALKGYVEGNIYQRNDFFFQRFGTARSIFSKHLFKSLSVQNMPSRIIETFAVLGLFILIVLAKWTNINDSTSLITIGAFMAAAYKIIPGLVKIINVAGQMKTHDLSISDLQVGPVKRGDEFQSNKTPIETLELKKIGFSYGEQQVLKDFYLKIDKGNFIGMTGKSGKGKTTILNLLLGFLTPSTGEILINGSPVSVREIKEYWKGIAYVRQQTFLIHDTILRNITLQEESYDEKALESALTVAGLNDMVQRSPEGLKKMITENGKNISGGQQQRIAMARALYKNADLVLLDEPFNELDEASTILLLQHFKRMSSEGKMILMITHDSKSLSYCSKIISLDE